jgi:MoaA/NifB/PqqE/SkfB family radical SAM enzyme
MYQLVVNAFGVKNESGQLKNQSKTFCMHPFTGLATREDGAIQACCRSHPIGFIDKETLEEVWNNDNMKRIRQQVLNGERPKECEPCFGLEDHGVESLRQRHIEPKIPESRITLYPNALDSLREDFSMPFEMPTIELKLNNLCNLRCRMCHPMDSTAWTDWDQVENFYKKEKNILTSIVEMHDLKKKPFLDKFQDNPKWWKSLEKLLPYFRRVEFAGGEPLMDPQHYRILDMLAPYGHQVEIKYATNLTILGINKGRTIYDYWPKFKSVAINVSIDGIGESYEYIRGNGNWKELVDNIKRVQQIPNITRIVGAVAVQVSNALVLDQMIEYFLDELGIVFYTNMVKYPKLLSIQVLPQELKNEVVEKLKAVKERIPEFKYVKEKPILLKITNEQIDGIINFINAKDENHRWSDTIEFNYKLDASRNQSFFDITPEFKKFKCLK